MAPVQTTKMSNFRWVICALLFLATTINYMDRQVLSLTWKDFIAPEFHWTDGDYGPITGMFSLFYAIANLFAGKFIDWMGTKKGYLIAIFVWSLGAVLHAGCGWVAMTVEGYDSVAQLGQLSGDAAVAIATISVWLFLSCRLILAVGEAGNFPAAIRPLPSISRRRTVPSPPLSSTVAPLWVHWQLLPPFPCWPVPGVGRWRSSSSVASALSGWVCGCGSMRSLVRTSV